MDSNPRPVPPDTAPAKKPKYISIYLRDDKKMCALKKTKRFVRIYVLKIKDKKDYLIFLEFILLKKNTKVGYYWSWITLWQLHGFSGRSGLISTDLYWELQVFSIKMNRNFDPIHMTYIGIFISIWLRSVFFVIP